jgi:hypothetical protein
MQAPDALEHWDTLDGAQQLLLARQVVEHLPTGYCFVAVQSFRVGAQSHSIALFDVDGARFALFPGGQVTLVYDPRSRSFRTPSNWRAGSPLRADGSASLTTTSTRISNSS